MWRFVKASDVCYRKLVIKQHEEDYISQARDKAFEKFKAGLGCETIFQVLDISWNAVQPIV